MASSLPSGKFGLKQSKAHSYPLSYLSSTAFDSYSFSLAVLLAWLFMVYVFLGL